MAAQKMFTWLSNVLEGGDDLMVDAEAIKSYDPRTVVRWLCQYDDCILLASELNKLGITDKRMHYDYLRNSIRKRKRYVKWVKKDPVDKRLEPIMEYYNIGPSQAKEYLTILTDDQIKELARRNEAGGNTKLNKKKK